MTLVLAFLSSNRLPTHTDWWAAVNGQTLCTATSMCGRVRVYSREVGRINELSLRNNQVKV